ncbi:MAG TPA: hypothetical protein PKJ16_11160 [Spirochaetota bacterium]|nr:hypothetical protein [Spirochaetota bacterium]HOS40393.1 hypothetical protein [Spirochaetota bacterium]HPU89057.1 hypothetical protein [Spirochaetota bacterium]
MNTIIETVRAYFADLALDRDIARLERRIRRLEDELRARGNL